MGNRHITMTERIRVLIEDKEQITLSEIYDGILSTMTSSDESTLKHSIRGSVYAMTKKGTLERTSPNTYKNNNYVEGGSESK